MTIQTANCARKLYNKISSGSVSGVIDEIMSQLEKAIKFGGKSVVHSFTEETSSFNDLIQEELKNRGFTVDFHSAYEDYRDSAPAYIVVKF